MDGPSTEETIQYGHSNKVVDERKKFITTTGQIKMIDNICQAANMVELDNIK